MAPAPHAILCAVQAPNMPRRSHACHTPCSTAAAHAARLPRAHAYRRSLSADGPPPAVASPAAKDRQFREGAETRPFQV